MSKYIRSTRECSIDQIRPDLLQALHIYFENHRMGESETEIVLCCETFSERQAENKLLTWLNTGIDTTIYSFVALTSSRLIWGKECNSTGIQIISAELKNIQARAHVSVLTKDTGLEVSGVVENSKGNVRGIIGLGTESAAQNFCQQVEKAIEKINPTPEKKFPTWMGGR